MNLKICNTRAPPDEVHRFVPILHPLRPGGMLSSVPGEPDTG